MVGVGWLVIMDDWLLRGGALGALLGFVIGGALLLPIGWVYGKLVVAMPDAAGEIAYTSAVFPRSISVATGWMMTLAYFIVCPWEAVAVGRIAGYIIPGLDSIELYRIAGRPVYLAASHHRPRSDRAAHLLNYRGIRLSATFQNWTSFGTLALFVIFVALGVSRGSPANIQPLFTHTPADLDSAGHPDRPLFHDRLRIGEQSRRRSQPKLRRPEDFSAPSGWQSSSAFSSTPASSRRSRSSLRGDELTSQKFMTAVAFQQAVGFEMDR